MKIAVVHSYYSRAQPSGENTLVDLHIESLQSAGHEVLAITRETDIESRRRGFHARSGLRVAFGVDNGPEITIREFKPDIVHVHNLFPNFGHTWLRKVSAPIVATVHNFRPLCPGGLCFRQADTCTLCIESGKHHALLNACYRDSRIATLPLYIQNPRSALFDPLLRRTTHIVCLAERIKQVYVAAGLDAHRISVVPNPGNSVVRSQDPGNGRALFVGRLGIEKGILEVIEAWPESESLDIVGDGPLANKVASLSRSNINYLGPMQHDSVVEAMSKYSALVVPSLWTESAPMVVVEALSTGLPIVSLRDNVVGDAITRLQIGVVIEALNSADISNALKEIRIQGESLRTHCRLVFEGEFTRDKWMERLGLVYEKAIDQNALGQVPHA